MWSYEQLYFDVEEYLQALIEAIEKATQSVDMEMYIFEQNRTGQRVLEALQNAANRGVRVRLILDGVGSAAWSGLKLVALSRHKVYTRVYHPLPRPFSFYYKNHWPNLRNLWVILSSLNKRNHKKTLLVDQRQVFVGSINIGDTFLGWRETGVQVRGGAIRDFYKSFELVWSHSESPLLPRERRLKARPTLGRFIPKLVRTNHTLNLRVRHRTELQQRIGGAQQRAWISNAYFVPSPMLIRALIKARSNGADVRLLLPRKSDVRVVRWVSQLSYLTLIQSGIKVYEYLPNMLHAKTVIADQWAVVGTTNLNYRSLYHDLEIDAVLQAPQSLRELETQFLKDIERSAEITEAWLQSRPWTIRLAGHVALLIRRWL